MTLDEQIEILQALKDGKKILVSWKDHNQFHERYDEHLDLNFNDCDYKVAPNKPREFYINIYTRDMTVYTTQERADQCAADTRLECVRVVEKLND